MARSALPNPDKLGRLLLRIVRKKKTCDLDGLLGECSSHRWTQVLLEVDRHETCEELGTAVNAASAINHNPKELSILSQGVFS